MTSSAYVLIVDDDRDVRVLFTEILTDAGHRVATASHGEEAIRRLCEPGESPDLILLDVSMPGMDGFEFHRVQQQYLRWAMIPVVVVTGLTSPGLASQLGVAAVLGKPVAPDVLLATVDHFRRRGPLPSESTAPQGHDPPDRAG